MSKTLNRKEFEKRFLSHNESGTQIGVITKVKQLSETIVNMALSLAELDFIKYVRITNDSFAASNENYPVPHDLVLRCHAKGFARQPLAHILLEKQFLP